MVVAERPCASSSKDGVMRKIAGLALIGLLACGSSESSDAPQDTDGGANEAAAPLGSALSVSEVAIFQAVKVDVMRDGEAIASTNAPLVADRPGVLRVYVRPAKGWTARKVTVTLQFVSGGKERPTREQSHTVKKASTDADESTTFDFALTAEEMQKGLKYWLTVRDEATAEGEELLYPADGGYDSVTVRAEESRVRVTLVPVAYQTETGTRLPDTGDQQLEYYRDRVMRLYPTSKVTVSVRESIPWSTVLSPSGDGWEDLVERMIQLRNDDKASENNFYVAAFDPTDDQREYCSRGCVLGLAPLIQSTSMSNMQVAVIAGFPGEDAGNTMAHEVGHSMGRAHAPCGGAAGPDPKFPYAEGGIGVPGYDIVSNEFIADTDTYRDIMGYCAPRWISDYTYDALFKRVIAVNALQSRVVGAPQTYRFVRVGSDGALRLGRTVTMDYAPEGEQRAVTYVARGTGAVLGQANALYVRYDHLDAGYLLVPQGPSGATIQIEGLGSVSP
jgi:hypothetical protein